MNKTLIALLSANVFKPIHKAADSDANVVVLAPDMNTDLVVMVPTTVPNIHMLTFDFVRGYFSGWFYLDERNYGTLLFDYRLEPEKRQRARDVAKPVFLAEREWDISPPVVGAPGVYDISVLVDVDAMYCLSDRVVAIGGTSKTVAEWLQLKIGTATMGLIDDGRLVRE